MAEIQMVQMKVQTANVIRQSKESSQADFAEMLKGLGQSAPEEKTDRSAQEKNVQDKRAEKSQEAESDRSQTVDSEKELDAGQAADEGTEETGKEMIDAAAELAGVEAAKLAGMMVVTLPQDAQNSQMPEEGQQTGQEIGMIAAVEEGALAGAEETVPELMPETGAQQAEGVTEAKEAEAAELLGNGTGAEAVQQTAGQQPKEDAGSQLENQEAESKSEVSVRPTDPKQQSEAADPNTAVISEAADSGIRQVQTAEPKSVVVESTPETLPADVGETIAARMTSQDGMTALELTLEPASLGKITIQLIYEEGKAAISLISDNPRTLEILSQRAGEIAQIILERTGQDTVVYTPEGQYSEEDLARQDGGGHPKEQQERPKKEQTDTFAQQLRLGLV